MANTNPECLVFKKTTTPVTYGAHVDFAVRERKPGSGFLFLGRGQYASVAVYCQITGK